MSAVIRTGVDVSGGLALQCRAALDRGLDRLADLPQTGSLEPVRDRGSIQALLEAALARRSADTRTPSWLGAPWDWQVLHEDSVLNVGVLTVFPRNPLPIHDHSERAGLLLVLSGSLVQRRYDALGRTNLERDRAVTLRLREQRDLGVGDCIVFGTGHEEIHSLTADRQPAVVFEVAFAADHACAGHWFLPIRPYGSDEKEIHALPFRRELPGFA